MLNYLPNDNFIRLSFSFREGKVLEITLLEKTGELPILGLISISAQTLTVCRPLRLDSEHHVHPGAGRDLAWLVLSEQGGRGHACERVFKQISFVVGVRRETVHLKMDSPQIPRPSSPLESLHVAPGPREPSLETSAPGLPDREGLLP